MISGNLMVTEGQFPVYDVFRYIVSEQLATIAIPLFFFISGFLFFYRSDFSLAVYGTKLRKRIRTLLPSMVAVVTLVASGIATKKLGVSPFLAGSSFFVYAYHGMPETLVSKYWVKLLQPASEVTMLAGYLLVPIFIVCVGVGVYAVMRKYLPSFTSLITGGR